jgi:hypothetical protein
MMTRERLTIDITVARDYLAVADEQRRERHERAVELFELAGRGEVELVVAPQGYRLDVEGELAEQLRAVFSEEGVSLARQLAYPSEVTFPGEDLIVGAFVPGFADAWNQIVATWESHKERKPPGDADRFHVETHVWEGRDYFITDDQPLLAMCRRLRSEHGIAIEAVTVADYLARVRRP